VKLFNLNYQLLEQLKKDFYRTGRWPLMGFYKNAIKAFIKLEEKTLASEK